MPTPALFGPELHVNTTTAANQDTPSVTALANGKFVVVWEDPSQTGGDTSLHAVRGQLYNADGSKAGGEFLVNQATANSQFDPVVTALTDGRFVVVWQDNSGTAGDPTPAIHARIFNVDGAPAGNEFRVNTTAANVQSEPAIAALTGGGFVITWTDEFSPSDLDTRGRAFDSTGKALGDEFDVDNSGGNDETQSAVVGLANGNYAVVWKDEGSGSDTDGSCSHIRLEIMSGNGSEVVDELIVNTTAAGSQSDPSIALLSDGNFIVTWTDGADIRGRIFGPAGVPLGADFLIEGDVGEEEFLSSVSALANGAYIVAWTNSGQSETDGSDSHVRSRVLSGALGTPLTDEFIANTTTNGPQSQSNLTTLADGRVVAVWADLSGSADDPGGAIRAQIFDPRTERVELFGTSLDDDFVGTAFNDFFDGREGKDTIDGAGGDDTIEGGEGADRIIGGAGSDAARYNNSNDAVTVNLATGTAIGGDAEGDILSGIENLEGSFFGDELTGDAADNRLRGLEGSDIIDGGDGNDELDGGFEGGDFLFGGRGDDLLIGGRQADTLNGGEGIDTASYAFSEAGVTVTLAAGNVIGIGGHSQGDTWIGVENLIGSDFADTLTGNSLANRLDGGAGADVMAGGSGDDTYVVDEAIDSVVEESDGGNDTVLSSASFTLGDNVEALILTGTDNLDGVGNGLANSLIGNAAVNFLDGGLGNDDLRGEGGTDTIVGGKGKDLLAGGIDADILTGGKSKDQFLFDTALDAAVNVDTIADFKADKDAIVLELDIFASLKLGDLKGKAFFEGKKAHDKNDHIIYNDKTGELFYDADAKGGESQVLFAKLDKGLDLSQDDFLIV